MSAQNDCPNKMANKLNNPQFQGCKCSKTAPQTKPTIEKVNNQNVKFTTNQILFQIYEKCQQLILPDATLKQITNLFLDEVKKGLRRKSNDKATVKCFVTYVQDMPQGDGCNVQAKKFSFIIIFSSV